MANKFKDTTAEKAIRKIVERIVEEVDGLEETVRARGGARREFDPEDYGDICMVATEVKEWADKLSNFAAVCEFGEADDSDVEKYVPTR